MHYASDFREYMMKLVTLFNEGKMKSTVDQGLNAPAGHFLGLERVNDAVDVSLHNSLQLFFSL